MSHKQKTACFRNALIPVSFIIMKVFKVMAIGTITKSFCKIFLCRFEVCWQPIDEQILMSEHHFPSQDAKKPL